MPPDNLKPKPPAPDLGEIEKLLEIELMQKRAAWQKSKARLGAIRTLSFFFLFLVVVAAVVAFFMFFSPDRMSELKSSHPNPPPPTPSPTLSPR